MVRKKILYIAISLVVAAVLVVATHIISIEYYKKYGQYGERAKRVDKMPEGYVCISDLYDFLSYDYVPETALTYTAFRGSIYFKDSDGFSICSEALNHSYFIVEYEDEYYVNEEVYNSMLRAANIIAEQRNRIYSIGEPIAVRLVEMDSCIPYIITIDSVEAEGVSEGEMNTIRFTVDPKLTILTSEEKKRIFKQIETDAGTIIRDFTSTDEGTVQVIVPAGEKIRTIVLKYPVRLNLSYFGWVRKVAVQPDEIEG